MDVKYININNYTHRVEYIPYEETKSSIFGGHSDYFAMLRNFKLMNNIVQDDNLFFIEKSIFERYKNDILINHIKENDFLVFPSNTDTSFYSNHYNNFNDTFIDRDITENLSVYNIYEKPQNNQELVEKRIPCDIINIYHPSSLFNKNFIIHISNVINNIHVHYLCLTQKSFYDENKYNSETEYTYNNNIYSEYITCYIPSIKELFNRKINNNIYEYSTYFKENLNIVENAANVNQTFLNDIIIKRDNQGTILNPYDCDESQIAEQLVPLALFTQPCSLEEYDVDYNNDNKIQKEEKIFKKVYFKYKPSIDNNYIITPINVTMFPYNKVDSLTNIYLKDDELNPGSCTFIDNYKMSLIVKCDFSDEGIISLLTYFDYPLKAEFSKYGQTALTEAYCFYHNVFDRHIYLTDDMKSVYISELEEINSISDIDNETIKFLIKNNPDRVKSGLSKEEYIQILKEERYKSFLEEYIDEYGASIDFFGFKVIISSDKTFKTKILEKYISLLNNIKLVDLLQNNQIDIFESLKDGRFAFHINDLFLDWSEMPDMVVCRVIFIDRFLNNEIISNDVYITKEKFKYMLNNSGNYRLDRLTEINNNMIEINTNNSLEELQSIINEISDEELKTKLTNWSKTYNPDNRFNFINTINCIVKNENMENIDLSSNNTENKNNTQFIYKPIFFKTEKLSQINIKNKKNQNIGIDLVEYMSKVDFFIMKIEDNIYKEIGRNSNYVIFNIPANQITNNSGTFEIYDQDSQYITYGSYLIIE